MTVKELQEKLKPMNPNARVLLRDQFDLAQGEVIGVDSDPTTKPEQSQLIMIWGNFN